MTSRLRTGATGLVRPRRWGRERQVSSITAYLISIQVKVIRFTSEDTIEEGIHQVAIASIYVTFPCSWAVAMQPFVSYFNLNHQVALEKLKLEQVNFKSSDSTLRTVVFLNTFEFFLNLTPSLWTYVRMLRVRTKTTQRRRKMWPGCWRRLLELNWRRSW